MRAYISRNSKYKTAVIIFSALALWAARHVTLTISDAYNYDLQSLQWAYMFTFLFLLFSLTIAHKEKPIEGGPEDEYVTVVIPAYNEDPKVL